ncbi:MAG: fucose isomerase, partial [Chloroflexi bacterium]|nr:fucose isomerase [Chloroflexota bacterium]
PRVDGLADVDQTALRRTLGTYVTLRAFAAEERLAGFAVRCWPEFFTRLGCAACGSSSLLTGEMVPASCEADVNGAVTLLILQWLSGEPAFDSDIVSFDREANSAVFWHCGKAPLAMADPAARPRATIHSNRQLPLLMEFPLKPGRVTLARLSETTGSYRLVIGGGEVLRAPVSFSGTSGVVRFDSPAQDVLDTLLSEGLEHHLALTYGDHRPALEALAHMLDIPVLRL